jgi:membrane associated rhomboid family serine protease
MSYYSQASRVFFGGPVTRTVKILIITNVAVFLVLAFSELAGSHVLISYFGLIPARVTHQLMLWQLVTYMFLHAEILHLFFNMLTLFMFGNDLERHWGTERFLKYYFITGIGAGVCSWLVAMDSAAATIGASGAIYGLLLAYGLLYPDRIVFLNFLIPVKVKYLVLLMGAIAFFSSLSGRESGISHIAHLGGMLVGLVFLKGKDWLIQYKIHHERRRREQLKKQFEVYYGEVRRKIDDKKKGPTIH